MNFSLSTGLLLRNVNEKVTIIQKEVKLISYHNSEDISFTIYIYTSIMVP